MKPNTLEELFDQIQIDADNHVIYNKELYLNEAKRIFAQSLVPSTQVVKEEKWISVKDKLPSDTSNFLALDTNQGNWMGIAWFNKVHKYYLYTGGKYMGSKENPHFTNWQSLPLSPSEQPPIDREVIIR